MILTYNLAFSALRTRIYTSSDYVAKNYPAIDSIGNDIDYMYNDSYVGVAVAFRVDRNVPESPDYLLEAIRQNFIAEIREADSRETIAAQHFTINMDPWLESQEGRVDIPVTSQQLKPDTDYNVVIIRRRDHYHQAYSTFSLYSEKYAAALRNRKVSELGLVSLSMFTTDENHLSLNKSMQEEGGVCFKIERDTAISSHLSPKYSVMFVGADKWHTRVMCDEKYFLEDDEPQITYQCALPKDIHEHGVVGVAIHLLDKCVAAATFDFSKDETVTGSVPDDKLISFRDCDLTKLGTIKRILELIGAYEDDTDDPIADINALVGLKEVKDKLTAYMNMARLNVFRKKSGLQCLDMPLHAMFLGSPGTGKTTVAKLIGKALFKMGILSKGHVVVKDRSSLVGRYYGSEEENVTKVLEEAQGGVLFIDEAYQLFAEDDTRDPGKNVINSLMTALSDTSNRDWMLILAGYPEPTLKLFEINPGLKSRIPETNRYHFADFSADELFQIATNYLSSYQLSITPEAEAALKDVLKKDYDSRDDTFGNARHAVNLIETSILPSLAERIARIPNPIPDQISTVTSDDIPSRNNIKEESDAKYVLDHMIGLDSVKNKIDTYMTMTQFNAAREASGLSTFDLPLHSMFIGSPGTGKTTVAKLMGKLLRRAGVLSKGHVVVRERSDFISKYYGELEKKVKRTLMEARGGILFIDEAYQLVKENNPRDPGREVIEYLMTAMADTANRDWMLILAGYTDEMYRIFEINPGLKSRIPESNIYKFDDYNVDELVAIASGYCASRNLTLDTAAIEALTIRLRHDYDNRGKDFGNARHVVNLIETSILPKMAARLTSCDKPMSEADVSTVLSCDIPMPISNSPKRMRLGFAV